jgi:hypothetical protein
VTDLQATGVSRGDMFQGNFQVPPPMTRRHSCSIVTLWYRFQAPRLPLLPGTMPCTTNTRSLEVLLAVLKQLPVPTVLALRIKPTRELIVIETAPGLQLHRLDFPATQLEALTPQAPPRIIPICLTSLIRELTPTVMDRRLSAAHLLVDTNQVRPLVHLR